MRIRLFLILGAATIMVALSAAPVHADRPTSPDEPLLSTFDAWNPCLGIFEQHTIVFTPFDHFHASNIVFQDKNRHGWTESGYVMQHGQFHVVSTGNGSFIRHFIDLFRHPDGPAFLAKGTLRFTGNSPVDDDLTLTCLTGPTIAQP